MVELSSPVLISSMKIVLHGPTTISPESTSGAAQSCNADGWALYHIRLIESEVFISGHESRFESGRAITGRYSFLLAATNAPDELAANHRIRTDLQKPATTVRNECSDKKLFIMSS